MNHKKNKFTQLLNDTHLTYEEIAKVLGVTTRMLCYWRIDLALPRRPRGRKKDVSPWKRAA